MANHSALNDSLNKLSELSSSGEVAKINRVKRPVKGKTESAKNLLGSLLDDSAAAAEEERKRHEQARKRAEEEARMQREHEEEMAKLEAERAIIAEQQELEERKLHQAEMQAQLQRQKDIEAGIIDLEEEARQKREEEARQAAEAAAKAKKEAERRAAEELRISQQNELEALHVEQANAASAPKKSNLPLILVIAVVVLGIGGFIAYYFLTKEEIDVYALNPQYTTRTVGFMPDEVATLAANTQVVKQAADPKPVKKSRPKAKTEEAPAAPKPKPSLSGGKGGLFGNRKL